MKSNRFENTSGSTSAFSRSINNKRSKQVSCSQTQRDTWRWYGTGPTLFHLGICKSSQASELFGLRRGQIRLLATNPDVTDIATSAVATANKGPGDIARLWLDTRDSRG